MAELRLGSLFDGIGVFPLAAVRCGVEPVWASEIEKAPVSITSRHFPHMAHLGDVTKLDGGAIPPVHVITFGSPCQNLSQIGNRTGLAGEKSSLFFYAIRIIREMREATNGLFPVTAVAAGNAPDMVEVSFTMMDKYMDAGILEPLNSYFDAWEDKKAYDQVYLDSFTRNDDLLGLVSWSTAFYLAYNKALFEEAGIEAPPATWEEALEDAKLLNDPDNQVAGYATLTSEWTEWFFQYYVWQAGGDLSKENEDGTLELTFTDPAVIEAGKYYQELRAANVLPSDLTLKFGDLQDKFAQGKIAMMPFAGDWVSIMVAKGMKVEDIGLALLPAGPSGKSVTTDMGQCMVINAKTSQEKKDAAWEYIKFMLSLDTLNKRAENMVATGGINPQIYARNDFDLAAATGMPAEWTEVVNASKGGRLEFPGKAIVGSYVDRAVQNILTDPNADVEKEFAAAQESAQLEVVDDYNAEIKEAA